MAPILGGSAGAGLERLCGLPRGAGNARRDDSGWVRRDGDGDWVRGRGPIEGVELLQAWFGGRAYARHRHDTYTIGVTDVGLQQFDYRGRVEHSGPGDVFVLHPDEPHDGRAGADGGFGYRTVYVEPARIAAAVQALTGRPGSLPFVREPVSPNPMLARAVAAAFCQPPEPLALDTFVLRLAEGLLLQVDPDARAPFPSLDYAALARGRDFLDAQHAVVRSAELEAVTGLSRFELARQFRALYGTSPYRYSVLRRLDFARGLLRAGAPLADLAQQAGFADQPHFTRHFRNAYGVTPARFARLARA